MAVRLAGQILQAEIKPRDHARLINQAVAEPPQPCDEQNCQAEHFFVRRCHRHFSI